MTRRVLVLTASRADYGFLCPLLDLLEADPTFDVQLAVCGSHLSMEFGGTVTEIERDNRRIAARFETVAASDARIGHSFARVARGFADAVDLVRPDMVFLPGDRYEVLAAAGAALVARVPVVHYGGGQLTEGAWDDAARHAVTKLSHLHFTAAEIYRRRIIQMGENPATVFVSGSLGLDNIRLMKPCSREVLERELAFSFGPRSALITFHPATLDSGSPVDQLEELLAAVDQFPDMHLLFTQPNVDEGGRALIRSIEDFVKARPGRAALVPSLGRWRYLSALRIVDVVVGNSSSGIIEVPSVGTPTVNIGDRQHGRLRAASVLDCPPQRAEIASNLARAIDPAFRATLVGLSNPYGDGHAAGRIHRVLSEHPLDGLLRKQFYDINFEVAM